MPWQQVEAGGEWSAAIGKTVVAIASSAVEGTAVAGTVAETARLLHLLPSCQVVADL